MTPIMREIQELRELPTSDLVARYQALWGKEPRSRNREHLWKRCCWKLQEERYGGLSQAARGRIDEIVQGMQLPLKEPGRVITRRYKNKDYEVTMLPDGSVEFDGEVFRSLSAVAYHITGSRWNGKLFFNLVPRKRGKKK